MITEEEFKKNLSIEKTAKLAKLYKIKGGHKTKKADHEMRHFQSRKTRSKGGYLNGNQ